MKNCKFPAQKCKNNPRPNGSGKRPDQMISTKTGLSAFTELMKNRGFRIILQKKSVQSFLH